MKFGLCTLANQEAPVETVIEQAAAAGYDGVEIWGRPGERHVRDGSAERCERIVAAADEHGVELATYGSYLRPGADEFADRLAHELDVAARLGADRVRVWAGEQEHQERTDDHWDRVVADLGAVADGAADRGLDVTVEKHQGTLTNTLDGCRRLLDAVDRANVGLNWQPLFSLPNGHLVEEARELAPVTNQLHVQALAEQCGRGRSPLSEAYFDLPRLLSIFADAGFDGYANVEFVTDDRPFEEAIRADLASLRSAVE